MHLLTPQRPAQTTHGTTPSCHDGVTVTPAKPGKLLRLPCVLDLVALKKTSWYGLVRDGKAPQSVRLAARAVAWREADVLSWIAGRTTAGSVAE